MENPVFNEEIIKKLIKDAFKEQELAQATKLKEQENEKLRLEIERLTKENSQTKEELTSLKNKQKPVFGRKIV